MSAPTKRILPPLPPFGAPLGAQREWLTRALNPPDEFVVDDFRRFGRNREDPCELTLRAPGGGRLSYEFPTQRGLSTPGALRAAITAASDGLLRMPKLTTPELEDIWTGLCSFARISVDHKESDEAYEWLSEIKDAADPLTDHTLEQPGRLDALLALTQRRLFDRQAARELLDPNAITPPRPTLLIDSQTGLRYMRVGEVVCFLRQIIGIPSTGQPRIDSRLEQIGVERLFYEVKNAGARAKAQLYRLPPSDDTTENDEESPRPADSPLNARVRDKPRVRARVLRRETKGQGETKGRGDKPF
jgi:hypothetical protein